VDDARVRQYLLERHGIEIAGGFGPLAGKIFRIGLMGYGSTAENVLMLLGALEEALVEQGYQPAASGKDAAATALDRAR
jgi:alanine-glyoxylate transaminase/serine-glyoxylate transaminase/serine-pyruvate transaminase